MLNLNLTTQEQKWFNNALVSPHNIKVSVYITDMVGNHRADVSAKLIDGQVNVDATSEITRTCSLTLLDPERSMGFDTNSPADGAVYMDRMIKVIYSVSVAEMNRWVDCPVFLGPVIGLSRDDNEISIEAQGKEALAHAPSYWTRTYKKNLFKDNVVQDILAKFSGENKFSIPSHTARLPKDYTISRGEETTPWMHAVRIAQGMSQQLYYDGRGIAVMRAWPSRSVWTFKPGDGGSLTSVPSISYSTDDVRNTVWVKGAGTVQSMVSAATAHPLSPSRLGRNGVGRYLIETIEDDAIRSKVEADRLANDRLKSLLLEEVTVSFDSLPIPHLEPYDVATVTTNEYSTAFQAKQFSIPLKAEDTMSVGYIKRMNPIRKGR